MFPVSKEPSPLPVALPPTILLFLNVLLIEHPNAMVIVRTVLVYSHVSGVGLPKKMDRNSAALVWPPAPSGVQFLIAS